MKNMLEFVATTRSFGSKVMLMLLNVTHAFPNLVALPLLLRYVQYSHLESRAVYPEFLWSSSVPVRTGTL